MIQKFVDKFMDNKDVIRSQLALKHVDSYEDLVKLVITYITDPEWDNAYGEEPDPNRIHSIDDGDYQGTLLFVIAANGYQPNKYWYVKVGYGSCSGCDTLLNISAYGPDGDAPTEENLDDYMTLALHMVQGLRPMFAETV